MSRWRYKRKADVVTATSQRFWECERKIAFLSKKWADKHAETIGKQMRAYACTWCRHWHLTSKV